MIKASASIKRSLRYGGFYISSQNHWPLWRCLIHLFYHHRLDVVPDGGDIRHCDAKQPHCEPAGGNYAQTAADHCKPDIISPTKTDVERAGQKHHYALRSCQRRRTTPVVRVAIKQFLEKELMPWTARRCSREAWYTLAIAGLAEHKNETLCLFHEFCELYHNWLFVSQIRP